MAKVTSILGNTGINRTSQLINDGEDSTSEYVELIDLGDVALSNDYNDLDNLPTSFPPSPHTHSITDVTGTKSQFNTSLTDGNFLFVGDVVPYTDEQAQDAIGSILNDTPTIDITYDDVTPSITASIKSNSITNVELANNINISEFINDSGYELTSNKGISNGYASLDSGGKIPTSQLPNSVMEYKGVYNAFTNSPTLVDGVGNTGDVYRVTVAGPGVNSLNFVVGDYVVYNGTVWEKQHSGADNVVSVFGRAGVVTSVNGDYTASQITNVPSGNISAITVQAALNELDTEKAIDVNVIHKTGDETLTINNISGTKTFNNTGNLTAIFIPNNLGGTGLFAANQSTGTGIYSNNTSSGYGIFGTNTSTGYGAYFVNQSSGTSFFTENNSTGNAFIVNGSIVSTGLLYVGQNNGTNTFTIDKFGAVTGTSFIKSGGTAVDVLLANGSTTTINAIATSTIVETILDGDTTHITSSNGLHDALQKKLNLPTGFLFGLALSINIGDNTKYDIAPGYYTVTDFTDLANPIVTIINYPGATGLTPTYLGSANSTYIALDINQTIVSSVSPFTNSNRRDLAIIGNVVHSNNININVTNEIKAPIVASINQLHDFMRAVGFLNEEGNIYSPNGANLQVDKSVGKIFGMGINSVDYTNPHQLTIPSQIALTFAYRLRGGTQLANTTSVNPNIWDNVGVLDTVPVGNRWTIQRINLFQSGLSRFQPGQEIFNSYNDAVTALPNHPFVTEQNIADNAVFRCYLIVKQGTTDLAAAVAAGNALFVPVDKFGNVIGNGSVALTYANIVAALGYTPENVSNKAINFTTVNNTLYPSVQATKDYVDSKVPTTFAKVVYVNNINPNSATIFDLNNPPTINDNVLKVDVNNLYIGTDASTWVYNGSIYVTKVITSDTSNFYLSGTITPAGNTKTAPIERLGNVMIKGNSITVGNALEIRDSSNFSMLQIGNSRDHAINAVPVAGTGLIIKHSHAVGGGNDKIVSFQNGSGTEIAKISPSGVGGINCDNYSSLGLTATYAANTNTVITYNNGSTGSVNFSITNPVVVLGALKKQIRITGTFSPISGATRGDAYFTSFEPTIDLTNAPGGTKNVVAYQVNPTLTSVAGNEFKALWTQKGGVFINTATPQDSAILQVDSTTQESLPFPRMTSAQRTAIATPTEGLYIYQTDGTIGLYQYTSGGWRSISTGTGTANKVTKWLTASTQGDSVITDDGTNIGIGLTPSEKIEVAGNIKVNQGNGFGFTLVGGSGFYRENGTEVGIRTNSGEKIRILDNGSVGIGITPSPTAKIHIAASTTATAAMRLTVGSAPTTPNDGDIWLESNTNTGLKIRIAGVTKTVSLV